MEKPFPFLSKKYFMLIFLTQIWNRYSWQPKLIVFGLLLLVIIFGWQYCGNLSTQNDLKEDLQRGKEARATEHQVEVNKAEESVNRAQTNSNQVIRTDSNKYSNNSKVLTNKFCKYMCDQGVLDSSCAEWASENNRSCN
jgi:hypothetical protein